MKTKQHREIDTEQLSEAIIMYIKQELWWNGIDTLTMDIKESIRSALEIVKRKEDWTLDPTDNITDNMNQQLILPFEKKEKSWV